MFEYVAVVDVNKLQELRETTGWQGYFEERRIERAFYRKSPKERGWLAIQAWAVPVIYAAFDVDKGLERVRFRVDDAAFEPPVCVFSVEASREQAYSFSREGLTNTQVLSNSMSFALKIGNIT